MLELTKQTKRLERQLCELEILLDAERQATAQRIEELERRLTSERETARKYAVVAEREMDIMWGDDGPHESGAECISCERPATQDTRPYCRVCLLAGQLEACDEGFGDAVKRIEELERQLQEVKAERDEWIETARQERAWVRKLQDAAQAQGEAVAWPHFPPCNCPGCKLVRGVRQAAVKGGTE